MSEFEGFVLVFSEPLCNCTPPDLWCNPKFHQPKIRVESATDRVLFVVGCKKCSAKMEITEGKMPIEFHFRSGIVTPKPEVALEFSPSDRKYLQSLRISAESPVEERR